MIKNYSFHTRINAESLKTNELFWTQARRMNCLWDALLELRQSFLETLAPLYEDKIANREALSLAWKGFDKALYNVTSEARFKEELGWLAREAVLESFKNAHKRALKTGGELNVKGRRIKTIGFYHRFTKGGLATTKIFSGKSKKISLAPPDEKFYQSNSHQNRKARTSSGIFGIGKTDEPLDVSVLFHRELPAGKLKTVRLKGELNEISREWSWKLVFAVESADLPETGKFAPLAALDLSWRRIGDYLRIGYLQDTAGNTFEIRLPLEEQPNGKARSLLKLINRRRERDNLAPLLMNDLFPRTLAEINEWNGRVGTRQQAVKQTIKKLYETEPKEKREIAHPAEHFLAYFQNIGRRGLFKLLWELSALDDAGEIDGEVIRLLDEWKAEDYRLRLAIHQTSRKLANKRKTVYENIALWLKTNYSHLAWEGDLSLKEMAEQAPKISMHSKDVAIKLGNKYRQFAGLSVLRNKLKEHDAPSKKWLVNIKSANTTKICCICGSVCEITAKIDAQCAKGHLIDVDANSTANMLDLTPDDLVYSQKKERILVPNQLARYIVPVLGQQ